MQKYVGLDVHSKFSVFVVQDKAGRCLGEGKIPTDREGFRRMRDEHGLEPGTDVALESGTISFHVADLLAELGLCPIVIDAFQVRRFCSRPEQKSDRRDAAELCTGNRTKKYSAIVSVPPPSIRALREAVSRRRHFVRVKTAQVNAAKRLLRAVGLASLARSLTTEKGWKALLERLASEPQLRRHVGRHLALWICAHEQVRALEAEIKELSQPWDSEIAHLMTAPGVGRVVASTYLAVVFDAHRFPSSKHVAGYVGLVPRTDQSGDRQRHGGVSKKGSCELRAMLCEAAQHARRKSNPLHPYFQKMLHKRGYQVAIIAVAHRLCRILYAMLRGGTDFELAKAGVEEGHFEYVSTRQYRLAGRTA